MIRFALELGALAVFAWWGYRFTGWLLAIALPAAAALLWGTFVSPKARVRHPAMRIGGEVLVMGGASLALGWPWGALFALVALVDGAYVWRTGGTPVA